MQLVARTIDFLDKDGKTIPALADAQLTKGVAGPFLTYVPPVKVLGGNVAIAGFVPFGHSCGRLFAGTSRECDTGMGDPYVEIAWARYFGTPRASEFAGAYPIPEGLSVLLGIGAVIPIGRFNESGPLSQALSMGTNIWDWAPAVAVTYTTPPLIGEGTEFSAKVYWNNYVENPDTDYLTGDLINVDFAVTEHIGRFQVGLAGFYAWQIGDDKISGVSFPPDGRRARTLQIGGVVAYDMPEHGASLKLKTMASPFAENTVTAWNVVLGWVKKF